MDFFPPRELLLFHRHYPVIVLNSFLLVKYIPTWFPGAAFRRDLNRLKYQIEEMAERPIAFVEDALVRCYLSTLDYDGIYFGCCVQKSGTAVSCIATSLMEQFESDSDRPVIYKDLVKHVTGVAYVAGVDVVRPILRILHEFSQ